MEIILFASKRVRHFGGKRDHEDWIEIPDITVFENNKLPDYHDFHQKNILNGCVFRQVDKISTPGFKKYIYKNEYSLRSVDTNAIGPNTYLYLENNIEEKTLKFILL